MQGLPKSIEVEYTKSVQIFRLADSLLNISVVNPLPKEGATDLVYLFHCQVASGKMVR